MFQRDRAGVLRLETWANSSVAHIGRRCGPPVMFSDLYDSLARKLYKEKQ
jgi:hypothetical protein